MIVYASNNYLLSRAFGLSTVVRKSDNLLKTLLQRVSSDKASVHA